MLFDFLKAGCRLFKCTDKKIVHWRYGQSYEQVRFEFIKINV